jgi:hypothetical protein
VAIATPILKILNFDIEIMAKKKSYPKAPKQSSSLEVWQKYDIKVSEVKKYNAQLLSDARKKKSLVEKIKKVKASR